MKKPSAFLLSRLAIITAFAVMLVAGCATKLSPTGVYQGDAFLYQIDQTIVFQKAVLQTFVKWEYDNRGEITNRWPAVTIAADKVRAEAPKWFALEGLARADYMAAKQIYDRSITATGASNSIPSLDTVKAKVTDQVNIVASHIGEAQIAVDQTTLLNRPNLLNAPPSK